GGGWAAAACPDSGCEHVGNARTLTPGASVLRPRHGALPAAAALCSRAPQLGSALSSCENRTGRISLVRALPLLSFSTRSNCCASGNPAGITILPPGLSCSRSGGGMSSGAAVTIPLSNGECSTQPRQPLPTRSSMLE